MVSPLYSSAILAPPPEKPQLLIIRIFVISLLFNTLSGLVIAFLPRNKCLNFMAVVTICSDFGAQDAYKLNKQGDNIQF